MPESEKILVTGATGLLGNTLVRLLLADGAAVRVLLRDGSDPRPLDGLDTEIHRGDIRDAAAVRRACEGCHLVLHAAAVVRIGRSDLPTFRAINVEGTRHVVEAASALGQRLVHVSTSDTIGSFDETTPADESSPFDHATATSYSISKNEAESVVLDATRRGLYAVIVNPSFMLGPNDWKPSSGALLLAAGKGVTWLAPKGCISIVDVRDVASAILRAAAVGKPGTRYLLTGERMSYFEALRLFARVTGRRPARGEMGPLITLLAGEAGDLAGHLTGKEPPVNSAALGAARSLRFYSSERAAEELGFTRRPLDETVTATWQWFREKCYAR